MSTDNLKCSYCGMENVVGSATCAGCGQPTPVPSAEQAKSGHLVRIAKFLILVLYLLFVAVLLVYIPRGPQLVRPRDYTKDELTSALRMRLTPDEIAAFENPLEATPEMGALAQQLVAGATNDLHKSRMIFEALVRRASRAPARFPKPPTAKQVFAEWNRPEASFSCQDFSFLYVALARAVGLKAYHVCVMQDVRGVQMLHGCAAVFEGSEPVLVDIAYSGFGIRHKRFRVLDDLQAAALYLCGLRNLKACRVAGKLAPDLPIVRANLFEMLLFEGDWAEAQRELSELAKLDPDGPLTYSSRAEMASHGGAFAEAEQLLRRAVQLAPETERIQFLLGSMCMAQGKLDGARIAYENALAHAVYEISAATTKNAIALIDAEECRARADALGALSNYDRAIDLRPDYFQSYMGRGRVREEKGDFDGAAADYDKVVQLYPDMAETYFRRGSIRYFKHDLDAALSDYEKAYSLYPEMGLACGMLGCLHYDRHEFAEALSAFRKTCKVAPSNDHAHFRIYLARSRMGELDAATAELQEFLAKRNPAGSNDWPLKIGQFLAGQITEPDFFKAAESRDNKTDAEHDCEAWFYAGSKWLLRGERVAASDYLEKCVATHEERNLEYASAVHELRFLRAAEDIK